MKPTINIKTKLNAKFANNLKIVKWNTWLMFSLSFSIIIILLISMFNSGFNTNIKSSMFNLFIYRFNFYKIVIILIICWYWYIYSTKYLKHVKKEIDKKSSHVVTCVRYIVRNQKIFMLCSILFIEILIFDLSHHFLKFDYKNYWAFYAFILSPLGTLAYFIISNIFKSDEKRDDISIQAMDQEIITEYEQKKSEKPEQSNIKVI